MPVTRRSCFFPHEIDHIIAQKHGSATDANNLALTCWRCNRYKGTDLGSFDPETGAFSFLFNPRTQKWAEHFTFLKLNLVGLTPSGRTTIRLLQINSDERLAEQHKLG
ncbi:MAG: HNH endonuclease signature motif containing protein [Nostoc sp.]|uniref:HNH endonuclease n=1 Tax=Nostoc sp. TaxID=1180 RepID=UPI002FF64F8D